MENVTFEEEEVVVARNKSRSIEISVDGAVFFLDLIARGAEAGLFKIDQFNDVHGIAIQLKDFIDADV